MLFFLHYNHFLPLIYVKTTMTNVKYLISNFNSDYMLK